MSSLAQAVPYERQSVDLTGRACGAACLSMVYRSLGVEVSQTEIWPAISKVNRFGQISSTTHLMTQDAVNRGFSAVATQPRNPLAVLKLCRDAGVRAIMNHRVRSDSGAGHYSVLVDIDDKQVVVHDPLFGEARRLSHSELMQLWLPQVPNSEIVGGVLMAVDAAGCSDVTCKFCHTSIPQAVDCPRCAKRMGLRPASILGCIKDDCIARTWNWVCCPSCDYVFTIDAGTPSAARQSSSPAGTSRVTPKVDVAKLFSDIDKFTSFIQRIPAASSHPDIKKQLEIIVAGKAQFKGAYAKAVAHRTAVVGQLEALTATHKRRKEAQLRGMEECNTPAPLDGDALARALMEDLGFTKQSLGHK